MTKNEAARDRLFRAIFRLLPFLPSVLVLVGWCLLACLPALDTRTNVLDESNLRNRGYNSQILEGDVGIGLEDVVMSGVPAMDVTTFAIPVSEGSHLSSKVVILSVPGLRAAGTEHFVVFSVGPSHGAATALAHSYSHQPFMSMDLTFYLLVGPDGRKEDDDDASDALIDRMVAASGGLPPGLIRGVVVLDFSHKVADTSKRVCVHTFGLDALQPNQDLLNVFLSGLRIHGSRADLLCPTQHMTNAFRGTHQPMEELLGELMAGLFTGSTPSRSVDVLVGALSEFVVEPLSRVVGAVVEWMGAGVSMNGQLRTADAVRHLWMYGLEMICSHRLGSSGGGFLRGTRGVHVVGLSDGDGGSDPISHSTDPETVSAAATLRVAKGVEVGLRSINNLNERLHHSSSVWLSSSITTFTNFSVAQIVSFTFASSSILLGLSLISTINETSASLEFALTISGVGAVLSMAFVWALRWWSGSTLLPQQSACLAAIVYFATVRVLPCVRRLTPLTPHFPFVVLGAFISGGLTMAMVALHPALSLWGGGVLSMQLATYSFVCRRGRQQEMSPGGWFYLRWLLQFVLAVGSGVVAMGVGILLAGDPKVVSICTAAASASIGTATLVAALSNW